MLFFLSWIVGVAASLCAIPLLLILGAGSIFGTIGFLFEMDFVGVLGGVICILWSWAGFMGLSGYWRWMDLYGKTLSERDITKLTTIQYKGICGMLAFLPISPAFQWFIIPIVCFIAYIFWNIKQKLAKLRHLT